jgi:hypothetical protein
MVTRKLKENKEYFEEKIYGCLEQYDNDVKGVKVIDEKFIKGFKKYLDNCFDDYTIELEDDGCIIIVSGYEIYIELE